MTERAPAGVNDLMRAHGVDPATYRPPVVTSSSTEKVGTPDENTPIDQVVVWLRESFPRDYRALTLGGAIHAVLDELDAARAALAALEATPASEATTGIRGKGIGSDPHEYDVPEPHPWGAPHLVPDQWQVVGRRRDGHMSDTEVNE